MSATRKRMVRRVARVMESVVNGIVAVIYMALHRIVTPFVDAADRLVNVLADGFSVLRRRFRP